ncbi:MAG: hypothetical protein OEZ01_05525 [Candidatus Heimdallarchaeota archaeon]|nr:hypothetical protein [Candidatus Heimdallarchaeota archaeon]MDH5645444.1 hypothetical protein [Candidatus Heimdallarchaeota archaeon]
MDSPNNDYLIKKINYEIKKRNIKKVPFLEIRNNRLQGVVSSGSDIRRVYVCVIDNNNNTFSCHTNNNRKCGGLDTQYVCSHLSALISQANLRSEEDEKFDTLASTTNKQGDTKARYPEVFARFQHYLKYLQMEATIESIPEMEWFISN